MTRDIVFVYDHFYPDYSAGGPVTSIANLANLVGKSAPVKVLTSCYYYDSHKPFENIQPNQWISQGSISVWYADSSAAIDQAIRTLQPGSTIYLNGLFSWNYFVRVLRLSRKHGFDIIISPRGMLQKGAIRNKSLKKRIYLTALKALGLFRNVRWHATDEEERNDIRRFFGRERQVEIIPNIPRLPATVNKPLVKQPGVLKLVCFSLITRKKNVGFIISLLRSLKLEGVTLDIVGPVKDKDYWEEWGEDLEGSKGVVSYLGDRHPDTVNELLSEYHLFVLPTQGENFGHAIVEAMSSWRPVLISEHTPWKDIDTMSGGFSIPLIASHWEQKLRQARDWSQEDFDKACVGAMDYFRRKINMSGLRSLYLSLFKIHS